MRLDLIDYADDWQALYKDGVLWRSDHSIRWDYDVLPDLVGETITEFNAKHTWENNSKVADHCDEHCSPPELLSDLLG